MYHVIENIIPIKYKKLRATVNHHNAIVLSHLYKYSLSLYWWRTIWNSYTYYFILKFRPINTDTLAIYITVSDFIKESSSLPISKMASRFFFALFVIALFVAIASARSIEESDYEDDIPRGVKLWLINHTYIFLNIRIIRLKDFKN